MTGEILYNIFIMPIELVVEFIFKIMHSIFRDPGAAIIGVSLAVNFLVLPLYKRSDAMQEEERARHKAMEPWLRHIRKTFKGDERYMMQSTYYRQQGYKPLYAIKGSLSLLLQIPFFMAAYHFLSNLGALHGARFLFLSDLGAPDGLIRLGALRINLLPVLMTVINIISGAIYTRGLRLREKLQLYIMALVFLVLLYDSPSGLVFYWTLNNVFSLCKNIVMKLLARRKEAATEAESEAASKQADRAAKAAADPEPTDTDVADPAPAARATRPSGNRIFILAAAFLTVLLGAVIPLTVLSSSPEEFIFDGASPMQFLISSVTVSAGFFLLWIPVFYYLTSARARRVFTCVLWVLALVGLANFFFFTADYGFISAYLVYDESPAPEVTRIIVNYAVCLVLCAGGVFLLRKFPSAVRAVLVILIMAGVGLGVYQSIGVVTGSREAMETTQPEPDEIEPVLPLSRNGRNVIVLMLDRAISCYVPDIFAEKSEVADAFDGFTYYPNTLAFSPNTNMSTPALFGGYEYRPDVINRRSSEKLQDKHNEALLVLPRIFADAGSEVTVCDPPYAGKYKWVPDVSLYDKYPHITGRLLERKYTGDFYEEFGEEYMTLQKRSFVYYSLFRCSPLLLGELIYDDGQYLSTAAAMNANSRFFDSYSVLQILRELTDVQDGGDNFLMMQNSTTHEPVYLEVPAYEPSAFITKGVELTRLPHYMVNMATFMKLADWFDFMRENGVWDNTRIIIVSDHGRNLGDLGDSGIEGLDIEYYNAMLLVKDFGATGHRTDDTFMTIADVASLATADVIDDPVNPYSGKPISDAAKYTEDMLVTTSRHWSTSTYNGNTFDTSDGKWYAVKENIFDPANWREVPDPAEE